MQTKRIISPHKGGRTAMFPRARLTPAVREMLDAILEREQISAADWVSGVIEREFNKPHSAQHRHPADRKQRGG